LSQEQFSKKSFADEKSHSEQSIHADKQPRQERLFGYEAGNATKAILRQNLPNHNFARSIER
jgi:hypothetical protein